MAVYAVLSGHGRCGHGAEPERIRVRDCGHVAAALLDARLFPERFPDDSHDVRHGCRGGIQKLSYDSVETAAAPVAFLSPGQLRGDFPVFRKS